MRDLAVIDEELRLVTRAWCVARERTHRTPSTDLIDQLLDERAARNRIAYRFDVRPAISMNNSSADRSGSKRW